MPTTPNEVLRLWRYAEPSKNTLVKNPVLFEQAKKPPAAPTPKPTPNVPKAPKSKPVPAHPRATSSFSAIPSAPNLPAAAAPPSAPPGFFKKAPPLLSSSTPTAHNLPAVAPPSLGHLKQVGPPISSSLTQRGSKASSHIDYHPSSGASEPACASGAMYPQDPILMFDKVGSGPKGEYVPELDVDFNLLLPESKIKYLSLEDFRKISHVKDYAESCCIYVIQPTKEGRLEIKIAMQEHYYYAGGVELLLPLSHVDLARGKPVIAAGEIKVKGGQIEWINNASGHYRPRGSRLKELVEQAFVDAGYLEATNKYKPLLASSRDIFREVSLTPSEFFKISASEEEPAFPPGSVGAAKSWTKRGRLAAVGLPTTGKVRYIPPARYEAQFPLPRGEYNGYLDHLGNEWVKGRSVTKGEPFEWDVRLSKKGEELWGGFMRKTPSGPYMNVSMGGHVTH